MEGRLPGGDCLVTGGCGFIGRVVVERLLARGNRVRVLDPAEPPAWRGEGVTHYRNSILDGEAVSAAMRGVGTVFHIAAVPHLWLRNPADFNRVNYGGAKVVLDAARQEGVARFVHTSTEALLRGPGTPPGGLLHADGPLPPEKALPGPYARSKRRADALVRAAADEGFPAVIVYPTVPLGGGDENLSPPTRMIRMFLENPPPAYLDCGLNLVAVEDVAEGHIRAAERGAGGDRFILGGENRMLGEVLECLHAHGGPPPPERRIPYAVAWAAAVAGEGLARLTGSPPAASLEGVRLARAKLWCDGAKTKSALGLPEISVEAALARSVAWLRKCGETGEAE